MNKNFLLSIILSTSVLLIGGGNCVSAEILAFSSQEECEKVHGPGKCAEATDPAKAKELGDCPVWEKHCWYSKEDLK